jgi:hypothetical protein
MKINEVRFKIRCIRVYIGCGLRYKNYTPIKINEVKLNTYGLKYNPLFGTIL